MKLVIFGLTVSSSWGNGHATLWRGLCRALAAEGHDVVFFERDVAYYADHRDLHSLPGGGTLQLYRDWDVAASLARREIAGADVAMVTSYCADGIAASNLVLDSNVPLRVFYDMDTPVTLEHLQAGRAVAYLGTRGLRDFDLVLSYTGGRALDALRTRLGARRVAPLYGSVDPDVHRPAEPLAGWGNDLSWLGTYAEDRQPALEQLLIEPARHLPSMRFLIGGSKYPQQFPWADNISFVHHVEPERHPVFYSSSRLTLNVTRRAMRDMGYCPSGRLFEAAACGTPILTDDLEGLDTFFEPGSEVLVAHGTRDAMAALELPPATLSVIAHRARERVLDEHTAAHRVRELVGILEGGPAGAPARPSPSTAPASVREV
ncbi:MAG TPA: glycosyltransferase [Woeseiaceae bacterium]|nr:glycosyltransferase [Woeseiaceae bacterium]